MAEILVEGGGIAACCCVRLLQAFSFRAVYVETYCPKVPAILLSRATQKLLSDIFECDDLFAGFSRTRMRVVRWRNQEPVAVPHFAIVASEQALLERLWARVRTVARDRPERPEQKIVTTRSGNSPEEMHFGRRQAKICAVRLNEAAAQDACWIESVEEGWLFLVPVEAGRGSLITVGSAPEVLLGRSQLIAPLVEASEESVGGVPVYPRIASEVCGRTWLACGGAAMSFDPLCGEGAGNAAREAILACAAVRAMRDGENADEIVAEYSLRLMLGFYRHLNHCKSFYRMDSASRFWSSELELLDEGIRWNMERLRNAPKSRFRLAGFELERLDRNSSLRSPDV